MIDFVVLFAAIYAFLLAVFMTRWHRLGLQGLVLSAIFAAALANGLLYFGVLR